MKRRKPVPGDSLKPGQIVTWKDGSFAGSTGHVVAITSNGVVQVRVDQGSGTGHEIVTTAARLVSLPQLDPPKETRP